jgi:DNA mismatch repair protein MutS2
VAQDRLLSTLDRLVHSTDIKPYLQDALVTQRQGRYVIPVRADAKGFVDGIVHDQSASGATLFIEPLKVVQQNNAVRELELQEEREIRRILGELSDSPWPKSRFICAATRRCWPSWTLPLPRPSTLMRWTPRCRR